MTNIIVAVNDKAIERYLSTQLPSINVLCVLKRREQVIDAVINRNPHMLVLSSVLGGKMDMREMITILRQTKPKLKIGFVYGERDDEYKAFIDFLIRQGIYDFILGEITPDSLSALVLKDTPFEAVEPYLLENAILDVPPAAHAIAQPEPETQAADVRVIEKIKYVGNITVGVGSLFPRAGCTHTALEIGRYFRALKKDVGVCVDADTLSALRKYYLIGEMEYNIKGCMVYDDLSLARQKHRLIVLVCGHLWQQNDADSFYKHNLSVLLCPSAPWEIDRLTDFLRDNPFATEIRYLFWPIGASAFSEIRRNMEQGGCRAYRLAYSPDWQNPDRLNGKIYLDIFKPLLEQI